MTHHLCVFNLCLTAVHLTRDNVYALFTDDLAATIEHVKAIRRRKRAAWRPCIVQSGSLDIQAFFRIAWMSRIFHLQALFDITTVWLGLAYFVADPIAKTNN